MSEREPKDEPSEVLARLPHFRGLDEELLGRVARTARPLVLQAGEPLFAAGEPCRGFFVVIEGAVRLFCMSAGGQEQVVHQSRAGGTFGEAALFRHGRYPVFAEAIESPTRLLLVRGEPFLALFRSEPRLAESMVASLCQRLLGLVERVQELGITSAEARLAWRLSRLSARRQGGALVIEIPGTKRELAAELSMTPETLSRLLKRWRDAGIVEVDGAIIRILDVAGLLARADGATD